MINKTFGEMTKSQRDRMRPGRDGKGSIALRCAPAAAEALVQVDPADQRAPSGCPMGGRAAVRDPMVTTSFGVLRRCRRPRGADESHKRDGVAPGTGHPCRVSWTRRALGGRRGRLSGHVDQSGHLLRHARHPKGGGDQALGPRPWTIRAGAGAGGACRASQSLKQIYDRAGGAA